MEEQIKEILKDYRTNIVYQMGFILGGKHRLDIKTADKMLIDTPTQQLLLLVNKEVVRKLEELKGFDWVGEDDSGHPVSVNDLVCDELALHIAQLRLQNSKDGKE